jgi:hypothetical protein
MKTFFAVVSTLLVAGGLLLAGEPAPVGAAPPLPLTGDGDLYEPNDTPAQAYGPLVPGQIYAAYIWNETDVDDYYYFIPSTLHTASVSLSHIPASCDYDLYVYYFDGDVYQPVARSVQYGNVDEDVTFVAVEGQTYYVRVSRYEGFSNLQPYHLAVEKQHQVYLPLVARSR